MKIYAPAPITCTECGFTTTDLHLVAKHSCDVTQAGGRCEDYPCCGHEAGDCNGQLYGSDEAIKAQVEADWANGHGYCDHQAGIYQCDGDYFDDEADETDSFGNEIDDETDINAPWYLAATQLDLEGEAL